MKDKRSNRSWPKASKPNHTAKNRNIERSDPNFDMCALPFLDRIDLTSNRANADFVGLLRFLQQIANVAIQRIDSNYTICYWNQSSETLYGYPASFAVGKRYDELLVNEAALPEFHESLQTVCQNKVAPSFSYWLFKLANNEDLWVQGVLLPCCRNGKVKEVLSIQINGNAHHKTEAHLNQDNKEIGAGVGQQVTEYGTADEKRYHELVALRAEKKELLEANAILQRKTNQLTAQLNVATIKLENTKKELIQSKNEVEEINKELLETNRAVSIITRNIEKKNEVGKEKTGEIIIEKILPTIEHIKLIEKNHLIISELNLIENHLRELSDPNTKSSSILSHLGAAELKVALMIKNGLSTKNIAQQMGVSIYTIITHRKRIRKKLGLNNTKINLENFLLTNLK